LNYKGTWDANANSPALTSSVGTKGDYYVVGTAGATNLNGISNWGVGDWAAFNGSVWQRVEGGANLNGVDLSVSGTTTLSGLTASTALALDASKNVVSVTNTGTGNNVLATSPSITTPKVITSINDTNANELLKVTATASAVNEVTLANAAAGSGPVLSATGDDTNIDISVLPKGSAFTKVKLENYRNSAGEVIINNATPQKTIAQLTLGAGTWLLTSSVSGVVSSGLGTVASDLVFAINTSASVPAWNSSTGTFNRAYYPQSVNGYTPSGGTVALQTTIASPTTFYLYGGPSSISSSLVVALLGYLNAVKISE